MEQIIFNPLIRLSRKVRKMDFHNRDYLVFIDENVEKMSALKE